MRPHLIEVGNRLDGRIDLLKALILESIFKLKDERTDIKLLQNLIFKLSHYFCAHENNPSGLEIYGCLSYALLFNRMRKHR